MNNMKEYFSQKSNCNSFNTNTNNEYSKPENNKFSKMPPIVINNNFVS
jgi:hypothetical protein